MLIIDRSQRNGVTAEWTVKPDEADDEEAEWFKLAEPFEHLNVVLGRQLDMTIYIVSKQPLPDELTVTVNLINQDTEASVALEQTNRNKAIARSYDTVYLTDYKCESELIQDWMDQGDRIVYRVVMNDTSVFGFMDEVIANHKHAFNLELATDVKLLVGGQVIKASKYVLMSQSDVFRTMLERWDEKKGNEVEIKDIEYEPMLAVVQAMYTGSIKLQSVEFALKMMKAAVKYNVTAIKNPCFEYIGNNLATANVLSCLIVANKLVVSSLISECMKFLSKLDKLVLAELEDTEKWKELKEHNWFTAMFEM